MCIMRSFSSFWTSLIHLFYWNYQLSLLSVLKCCLKLRLKVKFVNCCCNWNQPKIEIKIPLNEVAILIVIWALKTWKYYLEMKLLKDCLSLILWAFLSNCFHCKKTLNILALSLKFFNFSWHCLTEKIPTQMIFKNFKKMSFPQHFYWIIYFYLTHSHF